ncbi:helix-turn-helix transcriptional regulator [Streptomyces klenkii]|uniref:helix-turn-helix domain-containing protein n=1 Tax=Streptomyces klenkii TaxID=1420899 RepID=UPI00339FB47C
MPAPKRLDPAGSRVAKFGAFLRELREAKGWSQAKLGSEAAMSNSLVSKIETGDYVPTMDHAVSLDRALSVKGRLIDALDRMNDSPDAKWVQKYFKLESTAIKVRQLSGLIPALLQNDEYTRAILERNLPLYGGDLEEKIAYRRRRRAILLRPDAPGFSVVVGEGALHTVISDAGVMRRQLLDLIDASVRPGVEVRVMSFDGGGYTNEVGNLIIFDPKKGRSTAYRAGGVGGLFITNPAHVAEYAALYDQFHADALDAEASRMLIRKVVEEKYPCVPPGLTCP